jgi:acetate---CoA ligase (ADP-forming)
LKVLGPLHKSDLGGVRLNITTAEKAEQAWKELMRIKGAQGVMVQKMVEGTEVILGASRAEKIGHLVMVGLGGIYTEILKDVRFGLAPLAVQECLDMVTGIQAYPILQGIRGQEGISVDILAGYIERLSRLVYDFPAISEIDINPLKGAGSNLYVIDARIIMDRYTP